MSDVPFHRTPIGHRFYDVTVPALVREVGRHNDNLERFCAVLEGEPERGRETLAAPKRDQRR